MTNLKWGGKLIIICLLLCLTQMTLASHMIAVEIRARPVNCVNRTYEITLIGYVNTASMVAFGGDQDFLSFGVGNPFSSGQVTVFIDHLNIGRVQLHCPHVGSVGKTPFISGSCQKRGIMNRSNRMTRLHKSAITSRRNFAASPFLTVPPLSRCSG